MPIEIRPLAAVEEYRAAEQLQRDVWGLQDIRVVPDNVLITAHKNGGLVLGAFDTTPEGAAGNGEMPMVGYLFSFVGLHADGRVKHCSHQLGVLPGYQNLHIGYRMKLAQREFVLAQGITLITWTFDLLESRNAYLNLHRLGAVCNTYLPNVYGAMRDNLNRGLPSDRFEVAWHIGSSHVDRRLQGAAAGAALSDLRAAGVPVLNAVPPAAPLDSLPARQPRLLVPIPGDFQAIKADSIEQALAWRQQTRLLFEMAFAASYTAVDLLVEGDQCCYLLEKEWKSDED